MSAATSLLDAYPERFGWRLWRLTDAGLVSPIYSTEPPLSTGGYVEAGCPHGNTVPSPDCWCGIHYSISLTYCWNLLYVVGGIAVSEGLPVHPSAISFGVADGGIADDLEPNLSSWSKRARRYRPLHIAVSVLQAHLVPRVRSQFPDAEVFVITEPDKLLRDMERKVRTSLNDVDSLSSLLN